MKKYNILGACFFFEGHDTIKQTFAFCVQNDVNWILTCFIHEKEKWTFEINKEISDGADDSSCSSWE